MYAIETRDLTKFYGKSRGVTGVTLQIEEGEIFGFIGPNGAGKTTTVRLLLGVIFPTSGWARVLGHDCASQGHILRRDVGYLPGEVNYYPEMTVREVLDYSASFFGRDCSGRCRELADAFELDLGKRVESLSLGNRKKAGIVQALQHDPKLLILDEPTAGLDPLMQKRFFEVLEDQNRRGTTVFFSSHALVEVQRVCDRVGIIKDGSILQVEHLEHLAGMQFKKVQVALAGSSAEATLDLPGVMELTHDNGTLRFLYAGDLRALARVLGQLELSNLLIEEPSLEEVFMHYYEKERAV